MTYRLALGPAGLRLEIPLLIQGVAQLLELGEAWVVTVALKAKGRAQAAAPTSSALRPRVHTWVT
jgi:hypothetical protein